MIIKKKNSSIKSNLNLSKSIKEKRKEAKYQNNENTFLKMKQPEISLYNNINLRNKDFNKLDIQKNITNFHNKNIENNNNNLFIYKKNFFSYFNQFENQKIENNKRYKNDPDNSYLYNDKRFAYENIEKFTNLDKKNMGFNKTSDINKNSYSQFNKGKLFNASNIKTNDNIKVINKSIKKVNTNISSNISKRSSKQNYKNDYGKITISNLEKKIPNNYKLKLREKKKKSNFNENEEKNKFDNENFFSKEQRYSEYEIKSLIEKNKIMKNIYESLTNKIEKLELENNNLKEKEKENLNLLKEQENVLNNKDNENYEKEKELNKLKDMLKNKEKEIYEKAKQIKELNNILQNKNNENYEKEKKLNDLNNILQNKNNENYEKEKKLNELNNILQNKNNENYEKEKKLNELNNMLQNKKNEIYELKEKEKDIIKKFENIIKNKDNKISTLEIDNKKSISLLNERYNNKINELENANNEYKINNNHLEKKIKEYEMEIEKLKESKDKECFKIYGFINSGNNCYLNSSLQLLTRINEFKKEILSFQDNNEINKDNDTKGKLFFEIKKIITEIESSDDNNLIIDPKNLKYEMGNIDAKYFRDFQEDANEFISNFISGLYKETATKARVKDVKKLEINNEDEQKIYDNFYRRYYIKKGNSFLTDIFYGIRKTRNYCENCGKTITNSFNSYNMLELPLYKLVKNNNKKTLDLIQILNEYRTKKKIEFKCPYCEDDKNIYTETLLYTLPKYLMISFIRTIDDEYIYNNIIYNEELELKNDYDNKNYKYILKCVIEHSGGAHSGHYTALCPKDKTNNIWYRFSDSYHREIGSDFHSRNALILLYKSFQ